MINMLTKILVNGLLGGIMKFVLVNVFGVFFPNLIKSLAKSVGEKVNRHFEMKKRKNKYKKVWAKSESTLIECAQIFAEELTKS